MNETPTTQPMTIPAMAPPERPPLSEDTPVWLLPAETEDGVGVEISSGSGSVTLKQGTRKLKSDRST